ncbi:MAG: NAD(P)-dependent alcohol dehydrogenase [Lachnospiraceae bacterium]|nr:NAD(P)-dependent alcohol dehydrogenase [Lachnospiraceae bacterium]
MKIRAAVTRKAGEPYQIQEVELAEPKFGEILVKIVASGICHTDEVVKQQFIPVPLPAVLGHEGAGIVEKVGLGVTEFKPGDRVGITFSNCGECPCCKKGKPYICKKFNAINFGGIQPDGTSRLSTLEGETLSTLFGQSSFATHAVVSAKSAVKVEYDDMDLGLVAPIGCGIQTGAGAVLNRLRPEFGSTIAVFGCGTVGMSAIMAAKIAGCAKIIAVGGNAKSLELAMELGATHTVNRKEVPDVVEAVKAITDGGVDYSVDTTGIGDCVRKSLAMCDFGGTCVVVGATGDITFNVQEELMGDGKSLLGVIEGDSIPKDFIPKLIDYHKKGLFPFDKLIKFYDFENINEAVEASHKGECIKAVLRMEA